MNQTSLPGESVNEAAIAYIALSAATDYKTPQEYAVAMLEAAAPHMLAAEYTRGFDDGHLAGQESMETE